MNTKLVWILDEGSQGHLVQSRGLLRELAKVVPVKEVEIPIRPALSSKWARSLAKRLLRIHPRLWLFRWLYPKTTLPETPPDLIVSSGPHSLTALVFLAKHHGCPSVFVQGTLHVPEGCVTAVMRPFEGERRDDYILIPVLFTEITPQVVDQAKEEYSSTLAALPDRPVNTLFVGNSSARIRFADDDWDAIIRFVNELWKRDGSQWLVTTSYRTGIALEQRFRQGIHPDAILEAVWYCKEPRKVTKPFLGLADRVFVTMDSLTMLTEAVASGRPTYALCPSETPGDSSNTHLQYVQGLAAGGFIHQIHAGRDELPQVESPAARPIDYTKAIDQLITRLHWKA